MCVLDNGIFYSMDWTPVYSMDTSLQKTTLFFRLDWKACAG